MEIGVFGILFYKKNGAKFMFRKYILLRHNTVKDQGLYRVYQYIFYIHFLSNRMSTDLFKLFNHETSFLKQFFFLYSSSLTSRT